jgi:hypothetical protein
MKYRKKPIIVEAEQWIRGKEVEGVFFKEEYILGGLTNIPYVRTLEGDRAVAYGDYIITGVEGEQYPCKESIFLKTYEAVT